MIIRFVMIIRGSNDERNTSYPGIGLDWTRTLAVRPIRGLINTRERKIDGCWLTCMLVHRRSRKTGRYHRSCKSLRLSGTAAPASARPPSLQQNRRKKNNIHQRSNARKYFARSVKKTFPSLSPSFSLLISSILHRSTFTPETHPLPPRLCAYKSTGVKALLPHASNENDIRGNIPRRGFVDVHFHFNRSARGLVSLVFKCNQVAGRRRNARTPPRGKQLDLRNGGFLSPLSNAFSTRFHLGDLEKSSGGQFSFAIFETALYPPLLPDSSSQREESIGSIL